jgi:hypothetical protein
MILVIQTVLLIALMAFLSVLVEGLVLRVQQGQRDHKDLKDLQEPE